MPHHRRGAGTEEDDGSACASHSNLAKVPCLSHTFHFTMNHISFIQVRERLNAVYSCNIESLYPAHNLTSAIVHNINLIETFMSWPGKRRWSAQSGAEYGGPVSQSHDTGSTEGWLQAPFKSSCWSTCVLSRSPCCPFLFYYDNSGHTSRRKNTILHPLRAGSGKLNTLTPKRSRIERRIF